MRHCILSACFSTALLAGAAIGTGFAQSAPTFITNSTNLLSGANFNIGGSGTFGGNVNFTDAAHTIYFSAAGAGAGYALSITGETGGSGDNGGDIDITGGIGDPSTGTGGSVNISGGSGSANGNVTVNGANIDIEDGMAASHHIWLNQNANAGTVNIGNAGSTGSGNITMDVKDGNSINIGSGGAENINIGSTAAGSINMGVENWYGSITIGTTSYGSSTAIGYNSDAYGYYSLALGVYYTYAGGYQSVSIGSASAVGDFSIAIGDGNPTANGGNSIAMGANCTAQNTESFVYGDGSAAVSDSAGGGKDVGFGANSFTVLASGGFSLFDDTLGTQAMSITGGKVGIKTATPRASLDVTATDAIIVPVGTTAQRPATPVMGMIRFNTTTHHFEGYNGTAWNVMDNNN